MNLEVAASLRELGGFADVLDEQGRAPLGHQSGDAVADGHGDMGGLLGQADAGGHLEGAAVAAGEHDRAPFCPHPFEGGLQHEIEEGVLVAKAHNLFAERKQLGDFTQAGVFVGQAVAFQGVGDGQLDLAEAERFQDIVIGAFLDGGAGGLEGGESGHDDRDQRGLEQTGFANELDAVHFRHHDVRKEQHEIIELLEQIQRCAAVGGGLHGIAFFREDIAHEFADDRLVIHNKDPGLFNHR